MCFGWVRGGAQRLRLGGEEWGRVGEDCKNNNKKKTEVKTRENYHYYLQLICQFLLCVPCNAAGRQYAPGGPVGGAEALGRTGESEGKGGGQSGQGSERAS